MKTRRRSIDGIGPKTAERKHGRRRVLVAASVLLAALVVVEVARPFPVLQVRVTDGDAAARTTMTLPARAGERFEIRYTHSYNHFNVREFFEQTPDGRGAVVVDQYVDGNGAGIGETVGETVLVSVGDGWERVTGLSRTLGGPLRVRIGELARHELVYRCRGVPLTELGAPGALAEIGWDSAGVLTLLRAQLALALAAHVGDSCAPPGDATP